MASRPKKTPDRDRFAAAHTIETWPIGNLRPYERNSRTHSEEQVGKIMRSMERFGFTAPVLAAEDGTILAGHGRVMAAHGLGMTEVPVIVAAGWSDEERRAYVIADNQLALEAGWDEDLLRIELGELREAGFDISLTGFDAVALAGILDASQGETDPDDVPGLPAIPKSKRGDLWILGRHRLLCGDSTNAEDVAAVLGGDKPHLMVTDPPYGVKYDAAWRDGVDLNLGKKLGQKGSGRSLGVVQNDDRVDWRDTWALFPGDVAYVWHSSYFIATTQISLEAAGFGMRAHIIWAKQIQVFGRGDYHWKHEPCWYAVRKGRKGHWAGDRKQTTVWDIPNNNPLGGGGEEKTGHSTQKPVECMKRPIENNSKPGDAVYEPFSGSGTTIIAAEMTGRRCFAIELSPQYVDVAVKRWEQFTGQKAEKA